LLDKSQFLREEHTRLGQEAEAWRWVMELSQELEVAQASVLHKRGCATDVEQELATTQSALGAERVARALGEGQVQSRGQRIIELEVSLSQPGRGAQDYCGGRDR
jgi:hypothetical protein